MLSSGVPEVWISERQAVLSLCPIQCAAQVNAQGEKKVAAILDDGRRFEGDLLIGADGIWSKVHH